MIRFTFRQKLPFACYFSGEMPSDGITAVLAPSGSGKTTLFRFFLGLEKAKNSSLSFNHLHIDEVTCSMGVAERNFS
ncbi:MAG: hypothetical protein OXE99_14415, partial [Cellvibrionales bacterium]|nr:hypothetical protein [Cellvibrionales bacterium]